jgi:hypothetical protein
MATLLAVLALLGPFVALAGLAILVERRRARRHDEILRQITLTDALHARLGALVAPVVARRPHRWRIAIAVPFERPAAVAQVLDTVHEVFGRAAYEVVLSRQAPVSPAPQRARRTALRERSLSWT